MKKQQQSISRLYCGDSKIFKSQSKIDFAVGILMVEVPKFTPSMVYFQIVRCFIEII